MHVETVAAVLINESRHLDRRSMIACAARFTCQSPLELAMLRRKEHPFAQKFKVDNPIKLLRAVGLGN